MKVFALIYKAEFDNEEFDDVYLYDSFEKAHKNFEEIIDGWFTEELFNTDKPVTDTSYNSLNWHSEEYDGFYTKSPNYEQLYIEETNNVVNYLNVRVEELEVM